MTDTNLKSPVEIYNEVSSRHRELVAEYYDELLKKSAVDVDANRATVKNYNAEMAAAKSTQDIVNGKKRLRAFLIVLMVAAVIAVIAGIAQWQSNLAAAVLCIVLGVIIFAALLIIIIKVINSQIKSAGEVLANHKSTANGYLEEAWRQVAPLNKLFTDRDALNLISKAMPEFEFDDKYTVDNRNFLVGKYGFNDTTKNNVSVVDTLSGRFNGNPFVYVHKRRQFMGSFTYHGSLNISWTETETDSDGHTTTYTKTQTLHASVTKPRPEYSAEKNLYYGSQACPDLIFSRSPQHSERLDEKSLEKKIKKGTKKIEKQSEKATKQGYTFQSMSNTDFEVLFGATNRTNEVQFRVMYTPMAQRNTFELLTCGAGYGDDFYFVKNHCINEITSEHARGWALGSPASGYYSYNADEIKSVFTSYNVNYFKSLFFDFAPLMCVPVYMESPVESPEPADGRGNFTEYEHEVVANALGADKFAHKLTATESILKTDVVEKCDGYDIVNVTAYSFAAADRVDFVPVHGGDGHMHDVPVNWIEYIPVTAGGKVKISKNDASVSMKSGNTVFIHGMKGEIL